MIFNHDKHYDFYEIEDKIYISYSIKGDIRLTIGSDACLITPEVCELIIKDLQTCVIDAKLQGFTNKYFKIDINYKEVLERIILREVMLGVVLQTPLTE